MTFRDSNIKIAQFVFVHRLTQKNFQQFAYSDTESESESAPRHKVRGRKRTVVIGAWGDEDSDYDLFDQDKVNKAFKPPVAATSNAKKARTSQAFSDSQTQSCKWGIF